MPVRSIHFFFHNHPLFPQNNNNNNNNREVVRRLNKKKLVPGVLVGTHSDDKEQRAVTLQQGISLYKSLSS